MPAEIVWIPSGEDGTLATLAHMRQLAAEGAVTPEIRRVAARLVLGVNPVPALHARLIRDFIESHVQFLADPSNAEGLTRPADSLSNILRDGIAQMDCDCVAMLVAALGMSIGLRARFVVVAFHSPNAPFAHVWCDLGDPSGQMWWSVDPNRQSQAYNRISRTFTMEV
jgi:hypothetical protein